MLDLSMQQILMRLAAFGVIAGVHGFVLVRLARMCGDAGPTHDGRESLIPWRHAGVLGAISAVFFLVGWIKAPRIDRRELRRPRVDPVLITFSSLAATFLLAVIALGLRTYVLTALPANAGRFIVIVLELFANMSLWFIAINIMPVPPFTVGLIWHSWPRSAEWLPPINSWGASIAFVLLMLGLLRTFLEPVHDLLVMLATP